MDDNKSAAELTREERRFLLQVGDAGLVAFQPREDELIAYLIYMGLLDTEPLDEQNTLLRLTSAGQVIVARLRENMG